jgi:hypothetical protein
LLALEQEDDMQNIQIENLNEGENWKFGTFQVDVQPDGRR